MLIIRAILKWSKERCQECNQFYLWNGEVVCQNCIESDKESNGE